MGYKYWVSTVSTGGLVISHQADHVSMMLMPNHKNQRMKYKAIIFQSYDFKVSSIINSTVCRGLDVLNISSRECNTSQEKYQIISGLE